MKIISGGQIGVDIAALRAAKCAGLETGGYAPLGWRTKTPGGSSPELADYGLIQLSSPKYPPRTQANVQTSDATIIITYDMNSPGTKCTIKAVRGFKKPGMALGIRQNSPGDWEIPTEHTKVQEWLTELKVKTLNIAGNSNSSLEAYVEEWLYYLFVALTKE